MAECFGVPATGLSGGLLFACRPGIVLDVLIIGRHFISIVFRSDPVRTPWTASFVQCPSEWKYKEAFWNALMDVGNTISVPWLVLGDFNAVPTNDEKMGGGLLPVLPEMVFINLSLIMGWLTLAVRGAPLHGAMGGKDISRFRNE